MEQVCDSCKKKQALSSHCEICKQSYCEICSQRHNTNMTTKNHLLKSISKTNTVSDSDIETVRIEYRATHHRHIATTVHEDNKGAARCLGMTILPDGRLVVIDNRNKCLKLFKPDRYDYGFRLPFTHEPRGITSISENEVAVTFADKHKVRLFQVQQGKFAEKRSFKVDEKPFSISYSEGSEKSFAIEVGEGKDGAILITDMYGEQLKEISGYTRHFGLFTGNTIRLTHDHTKKLVYVVDLTKDCVNCVDYSGFIKWSVKVEAPRGINLHENTLFVASKSKNTVYQMKAEEEDGHGPTLHTLLGSKDSINEPRFITYQPQAERLAVEVAGNLIHVYNCSKK